MRIILINDYAYMEGGSSVVALQQAHILRDAGYDLTLFVGQTDRAGLGESGYRQINGLNIWSTEQPDLLGDSSRARAAVRGLWNFAAARLFARLLADYDPVNTVILLHGWNKILSASVIRACWKRGFPIVAMLHDYSIGCPNGAYHDFKAAEHCDKRPMSAACIGTNCDRRSYAQKLWRVVRQYINNRFAGLPGSLSCALAVSDYQKYLIEPWLEQTHCRVLRNYVQMPEDLPVAKAECSDFVFVGRLSSEKGALLFAEAAARADVRPVFVGDGPEHEAVLSLNPDARILGWVSREEVWRQLSTASVLVFTSILHETFGLAVYEAAAMGVPSIVPDGSAANDFVEHEVNGLVYRNGDVESLAQCLRRLSDDEALRLRLAQAAQRSYESYVNSNADYGKRLRQYLNSAIA